MSARRKTVSGADYARLSPHEQRIADGRICTDSDGVYAAQLRKEPSVVVVIPSTGQKGEINPVPVSVQGIRVDIPRGVKTAIPISHYKVLQTAFETTYHQQGEGPDQQLLQNTHPSNSVMAQSAVPIEAERDIDNMSEAVLG